MCIVYVDDLIFWSRDVANIDRVAMELCKLKVALEQEDDVAGFLGVKMECDSNTGLLKMKQTGLIGRVVEVLSLDDGYAWGKHTPAETKPLIKDEDGVAAARGSVTTVLLGCCFICWDTLNQTLPMPSTAVLGTCSAQNTLMN
jgi:hypothetical protein